MPAGSDTVPAGTRRHKRRPCRQDPPAPNAPASLVALVALSPLSAAASTTDPASDGTSGTRLSGATPGITSRLVMFTVPERPTLIMPLFGRDAGLLTSSVPPAIVVPPV